MDALHSWRILSRVFALPGSAIRGIRARRYAPTLLQRLRYLLRANAAICRALMRDADQASATGELCRILRDEFGCAQIRAGYPQVEQALRQQTHMIAARDAELERLRRALIGRERELVQLKERINELALPLGLTEPYPFIAETWPLDCTVRPDSP